MSFLLRSRLWSSARSVSPARAPVGFVSVRMQTSVASSAGQRVVWAWNEFDPLEEVIVGIADGSAVPPNEPGHLSKIWNLPSTIAEYGKRRTPDKIQKASAELDNFSAVLRERGITVRR